MNVAVIPLKKALRLTLPAPELLVAIPVHRPKWDYYIFAPSTHLKREIGENGYGYKGDHPNRLELEATIACLNFFEDVLQKTPSVPPRKLIQNDNWNTTYWAMVRLFESGAGFIAELDDSEQFNAFHTSTPFTAATYKVDELKMTILTGGCGKSYSTPNGKIVLEYVNRI